MILPKSKIPGNIWMALSCGTFLICFVLNILTRFHSLHATSSQQQRGGHNNSIATITITVKQQPRQEEEQQRQQQQPKHEG